MGLRDENKQLRENNELLLAQNQPAERSGKSDAEITLDHFYADSKVNRCKILGIPLPLFAFLFISLVCAVAGFVSELKMGCLIFGHVGSAFFAAGVFVMVFRAIGTKIRHSESPLSDEQHKDNTKQFGMVAAPLGTVSTWISTFSFGLFGVNALDLEGGGLGGEVAGYIYLGCGILFLVITILILARWWCKNLHF